MQTKLKYTLIFGVLFYSFIMLHKIVYYFFDDKAFLIQMFCFIALSSSTAIFESSFNINSSKIKYLSVIDITLRVITLIIHLGYLFFNLNFVTSIINTSFILLLNVGVYLFIKKSLKFVESEDLIIGNTRKVNQIKLEKVIKKSGLQSLIGLIMFILIPPLNLFFKYQIKSFMFVIIMIIILCLFYIGKIHLLISKQIQGRSKVKTYIEIICIVIGTLIIIISELIHYQDNHLVRPTFIFIGLLGIVPALRLKSQLARWKE